MIWFDLSGARRLFILVAAFSAPGGLAQTRSATALQSFEPRDLATATGCGTPDWPRTSTRFDEPSTIELGLLLDRRGRVSVLRVLKSTGVTVFDKAAMKALKTCRFTPAPEASPWISVVYHWHLD